MGKDHTYSLSVEWTGNRGEGTKSYKGYSRNHTIEIDGKSILHGSADPAFYGDSDKYNPEELLLASVSACHMLWYLHLCAEAGVIVTSYSDRPSGILELETDGSGAFSEITLNPKVRISTGSDIETAKKLHKPANQKCFIASSCKFPVHHRPVIGFDKKS